MGGPARSRRRSCSKVSEVISRLKGLVPEDKDLPLKPAPWTQDEADALHEMAQEFLWKKRLRYKQRGLRAKLAQWIVLVLGIPAALIYFFEPLERLLKLIRTKF